MTVAETITEKIVHLPIHKQKQILEFIERIEVRHIPVKNGNVESRSDKHPLTLIAELAVDMGVTDLAERHDFYAHGKLED